MQSLAGRKGEVVGMDHHGNRVSIEAIIPTRGLIGDKNYFWRRRFGECRRNDKYQ